MLKHVWGGRGAAAISEAKALPQAIMHVGHLVDFRWKLCMSVESNSSKKLGRAFVAVEVTVAGNRMNRSNFGGPTGRLCGIYLDRAPDLPCAHRMLCAHLCCCGCGIVGVMITPVIVPLYADNADQLKTNSFELSLSQFQNFASHLRESAAVIEEI